MTTVWFSLRRRLLALLLGAVSAAWLVTMALSYLDAHHEVDELFDAQLAEAAQTLLALASRNPGDGIHELDAAAHKYQRLLRFQLWHAGGRLVTRSDNAPEAPLTAGEGFSETVGPDGHWRHFSQWNQARTLQIQVSENHDIRDELIGQIAWRVVVPALLGLPLIGLSVWLATRRGLASLDGIARQIASRKPDQLQAVEPASAPEELRTMLEALNSLFRRVHDTLEAERRFTADAAHELRTPLAALQVQLQVAQRARDEEERERSLAQLQGGLNRAARLVEQMLQLARLDPESRIPESRPVDLAAVAEAVCAELGPQILGKGLDFELEASPGCVVGGQPEWLRILVRNLVDNAVRYTPALGRVKVVIGTAGDRCRLAVTDNGPGIPPEERERVVRRFHRLDPAGQPGSGLGLAIVARIAELHGTALQLDGPPLGGLEARVDLPLAAASSA